MLLVDDFCILLLLVIFASSYNLSKIMFPLLTMFLHIANKLWHEQISFELGYY